MTTYDFDCLVVNTLTLPYQNILYRRLFGYKYTE